MSQLHRYDNRLYYLLSVNSRPREFIVTAEGDRDAFRSAELLVAASPLLDGWSFIALKPPMGVEFQHRDGPIAIDVSQLWFLPLQSTRSPLSLGIVLGLPDAEFVLEKQSVDTAYTIVETVIGERECASQISHLKVQSLPDAPDKEGYLKLSELSDYIEFFKSQRNSS